MGIEDTPGHGNEMQALIRENKRLKRELDRQRDLNTRNGISAAANQSLKKLVDAEKSKLEQYMQLMLGNSPDIILLFDHEGKVVYASHSFLRRCGLSVDSMIRGKTSREVFAPYVRGGFLGKLDSMFGENTRVELEHDIDFGGGTRHYVVQLTPMIGDNGIVAAFMLNLLDITDLNNAVDEAKRARLTAEQSTQAKSEFLSRMSHEMRTPLNAIIGMTNIAQTTDDIERIKYSLGKMDEASRHLLGVINDVLDISKIEANKFELYIGEFDFEKMMQRVVGVNIFKIEEKHQEFIAHIDQRIPRKFMGDDQRLAQVITNLLSNAIKFTDEYGRIEVRAALEKSEGNIFTVRVDVIDSGIGLSAEQQTKLFKSFEQADGSISRRYGGTGLGLAISKSIVELMGGQIWVRSEPGAGSTFSFSVPLERVKSDIREMLRADARIKNLRVLAVDDDPVIREYFKEIMKQFGITCEVAADAEEALDMISRRGSYDIYFVDWQMPGKDGLELAREIKAGSGHRSIVVMISASEWSRIEEKANEVGVDRFLPKPIFPSDIMNCINDCLGTGRYDEPVRDEVTSFAGSTVLLADDVEINREIVLALLEPTGLTIECCENGREAVELFRSNQDKYDLIFMDIQMPEMDGYEATRHIRKIKSDRAKNIPIIAMTANVFREDIDKCLATGMNGHIGKPMNVDEVTAVLKQYLGGERG